MSDLPPLPLVDTDFEDPGNFIRITSESHPSGLLNALLQKYDALDSIRTFLLTNALIFSHMGLNGDKGAFFLNDPKFQEPNVYISLQKLEDAYSRNGCANNGITRRNIPSDRCMAFKS